MEPHYDPQEEDGITIRDSSSIIHHDNSVSDWERRNDHHHHHHHQQQQQQQLQHSIAECHNELKTNPNAIPLLSTKMNQFIDQFLDLHAKGKMGKFIDQFLQLHHNDPQMPTHCSTTEEDATNNWKDAANKAQAAFVYCLLDGLELQDQLLQVLAMAGIDARQEQDPIDKFQQVWNSVKHDNSSCRDDPDAIATAATTRNNNTILKAPTAGATKKRARQKDDDDDDDDDAETDLFETATKAKRYFHHLQFTDRVVDGTQALQQKAQQRPRDSLDDDDSDDAAALGRSCSQDGSSGWYSCNASASAASEENSENDAIIHNKSPTTTSSSSNSRNDQSPSLESRQLTKPTTTTNVHPQQQIEMWWKLRHNLRQGLFASRGVLRRVPVPAMSTVSSTTTGRKNRRPRMLVLGMARLHPELTRQFHQASNTQNDNSWKHSYEGPLQLFQEGLVPQNAARDTARIFHTEQVAGIDIDSVSLMVSGIFDMERHVHVDFCSKDFCRNLHYRLARNASSGQCQVEHPNGSATTLHPYDCNYAMDNITPKILPPINSTEFQYSVQYCKVDEMWTQSGIHFRPPLFQQTFPLLAKHGILEVFGTVTIPFSIHCFGQVVAALWSLWEHYDICFVRQRKFHIDPLWYATQTIPEEVMEAFGKGRDQDRYTSIGEDEIRKSSPHAIKNNTLRQIYDRLHAPNDIRLIVLQRLPVAYKHQGYFRGMKSDPHFDKVSVVKELERRIKRGEPKFKRTLQRDG